MNDPSGTVLQEAPHRQGARDVAAADATRLAPKGALERELKRVEGGKWPRRLGYLAVLLALIGGVVFWRIKSQPKPPPRYITTQATRGDVFETVQSTGQVQPVTQVQVGAQVSGRITKVYVDFNSQVRAGDVLAEIDQTLFGAAIDQNRAQLEASHAAVVHAEAALVTAKQKLDRAQKLLAEGLGTQADLEVAQGNHDLALADLAAAKANVIQNAASLRSSKTNLDYTRIYSPIDGVVITRSIDPGQTVAASFQAPVLFVIAQDLRHMRVLADVDEADVGKLKEGGQAEVRVDAFPGQRFKGVVNQVRYSPNNQSGVVTYSAVVEVENPELKLRPGMTATVTVNTAAAKNVLRIPNAALRFKPTPPVDKNGKKVASDPIPPLGPNKGRVYVVTDETVGKEQAQVREVDVGITDGLFTVIDTDLGAAKVVVDETEDQAKKSGRPF